MLGRGFSLLKPLILFVNALVALRQGWNIVRSGRNIQFWEDNKVTTLSMSISEMGWATFRSGSSLHDENEVKRRKPRWLSARPPMPRSPSLSLEFNKNPRASGIELATRRRSPGFPSGNIMRFDSFLGASPFDSISPYFSYRTSLHLLSISLLFFPLSTSHWKTFHPSRVTSRQIAPSGFGLTILTKSKYLLYKCWWYIHNARLVIRSTDRLHVDT